MIDWLTVSAQIANFLILLALLNRFLYRPILANMAAREQHIQKRLNEAGQIQAKAERLIAAYQEKLNALEEERARLLAEARQAAETERQAWLEKARQEVEEKRRGWQRALEEEQAAWLHRLKTAVAEQVVDIARKALADLAGQELEEQLVASFLRQFAALPQEQRLRLESASKWTVVTRSPLPSATAERIGAELKRVWPNAAVRFEQRGDLLCGIALETDGWVFNWHLAAWLEELEHRLKEALS